MVWYAKKNCIKLLVTHIVICNCEHLAGLPKWQWSLDGFLDLEYKILKYGMLKINVDAKRYDEYL